MHRVLLARDAGGRGALRSSGDRRPRKRARAGHPRGGARAHRIRDAGRSLPRDPRRTGGARMMRALFTVFAKEFVENLRDRRTLVSALLFGPLFGPILFGAMVSRMLNQSVVEADEPLAITISGGERAPNLRRYLESEGVRLHVEELSETDARARVRKE